MVSVDAPNPSPLAYWPEATALERAALTGVSDAVVEAFPAVIVAVPLCTNDPSFSSITWYCTRARATPVTDRSRTSVVEFDNRPLTTILPR